MGREGTIDSTSGHDRWAEERWRQTKETKRIPVPAGRKKWNVQWGQKERWRCRRRGGRQCPPLVQWRAHVSCENPIPRTWQIVLPWEQQRGYCGEGERKWKRERRRDGRGGGQTCSSNHLLLQLTPAMRPTCRWKGMYQSPAKHDHGHRAERQHTQAAAPLISVNLRLQK